MPPLAQRHYSPEEYLTLERTAPQRSEFVNGHIYAISGASREHSFISGNVFAEIRAQLRGRPCEVHMSDMRVKVEATGRYTYPDVVALCGEPRMEDAYLDTLLNPTMIVEVLSDSTERFDRGEKFAHYRRIDSLQEYVLIAQNLRRVEHYARRGEHWVLSEWSEPDEILALDSIGCAIPLSIVYEKVEFPTGDALTRVDALPR